MSQDDPFFNANSNDRTIVRPIPGGRRSDIQKQKATPPPHPTPASGPLLRLGQLNPLEKAASGLLSLLARLNSSRSHPNPEQLKDQIAKEIRFFQNQALQEGLDSEQVYTARYVMCTVLDEAALNTPWGMNSSWSQHNLLASFHKEVAGGEKFFQILKSLGQNPSKNIHLLELMYLCLSMGFQGQYRAGTGGKDTLSQVREWLYKIISRERGTHERSLSPHWAGVTDQRNALVKFVPLWVFAAIAAAILTAVFSGFLFNLHKHSDAVYQNYASLKIPEQAAPLAKVIEVKTDTPPIKLPAPNRLTLSQLLSNEITAQKVTVDENELKSTVTIQGDGLFRSGQTQVKDSIIPLLHTIGQAISQLPGQVLIHGHSDNVPIRSLRFPSNWELSKARADSVAGIIQDNLQQADRITTKGLADTEPVTSNKTKAGRAQNRRVEIILHH